MNNVASRVWLPQTIKPSLKFKVVQRHVNMFFFFAHKTILSLFSGVWQCSCKTTHVAANSVAKRASGSELGYMHPTRWNYLKCFRESVLMNTGKILCFRDFSHELTLGKYIISENCFSWTLGKDSASEIFFSWTLGKYSVSENVFSWTLGKYRVPDIFFLTSTRKIQCFWFFFSHEHLENTVFPIIFLINTGKIQFEGVPGSPGKSQKKGQEDQGALKQPGGSPSLCYFSAGLLAFLLALPWTPWNSLMRGTFKEDRGPWSSQGEVGGPRVSCLPGLSNLSKAWGN